MLCISVGGCGILTIYQKTAYVNKITPMLSEYNRVCTEIVELDNLKALNQLNLQEEKDKLESVKDRMIILYKKLSQVKPPDAYEDLHKQLMLALKEMEEGVYLRCNLIGPENFEKKEEVRKKLINSQIKINNIIEKIRRDLI